MLLNTLAVVVGWMLLASAAVADETFSWTGTYEGFVVCDDVTAGEGGNFGVPVSARIVQTGDRIDASLSAVVDGAEGTSYSLYRGKVMTSSAGDATSGYAESCGGTFANKELARFFPAATDRRPFGFASDTVFVSEALPGAEGKLVVESCKWSLRRLSTEPPSFSHCP